MLNSEEYKNPNRCDVATAKLASGGEARYEALSADDSNNYVIHGLWDDISVIIGWALAQPRLALYIYRPILHPEVRKKW
jgi:hypothetical protein